jgi:hypothetical protein
MLAFNVATLTISSLNALASSAIAAIAGVDTVAARESRLRKSADATHTRERAMAARDRSCGGGGEITSG